MRNENKAPVSTGESPGVIDLSLAPGERQAWDRPAWVIYLWALTEMLFVTNPWQISSRLRILALSAFGAKIGPGVIFRPRTRVKFPWKLAVGENSWIGEGVWIHNQDHIELGRNVVVSQETFLTTGSHAHRTDMALVTRPIRVGDGSWITSRCIVLGGSVIGDNCIITPGSVVSGIVRSGTKFGAPPSRELGSRD